VNTLKRYGVIWVSDTTPITSPMKDGYWTPWYLAQDRIAELEETVSKHIEICERHVSTRKYLEKRIAELEKFKTEHSPLLSYIAIECTTNLSEFKNWLAIRDLEQQAKGVKDFFASVEPKISMGESKLWELQTHNVNCYLDNLRNQAKGGAE
jgi:hypothetical protein